MALDLAGQLEQLAGRVAFDLDGRRYTLPQHPLTVWLEALIEESHDAIVPGLLDEEDQGDLFEAIFDEDDPLDLLLCRRIALTVITEAGGRPWYEVNRLVIIALDSWRHFNGWCTEKRIRQLDEPLDRFCDLVERYVLHHTKDSEKENFLHMLQAIPAGHAEELAQRPEWSEEEMAAGFDSVFSMLGKG